MAKLTERLKHPIPEEGSRQYYDAFVSFADSLDAADFASRENFNISVVGGGTFNIDQNGFITWTDDIIIHHPMTGYRGVLKDSSQSGIDVKNGVNGLQLEEGQVAYVNIVRNPQRDYDLELTKTNGTIPNTDRALKLFYREGDLVSVSGLNILVIGGGSEKPRGATKYFVGPTANFPYEDIQNAIDQAESDGATTQDPALVLVYPGTYTGDVNLSDGIHVVGLTEGDDRAVTIDGKLICNIDIDGDVLVENISVDNSGDYGLEVTGSDTMEAWFQDCWFRSSDHTGAFVTNNGPSDIEFHDCTFITQSTSSYGLEVHDSNVFCRDCKSVNQNSINDGALWVESGMINANTFDIDGQVEITNTGQCTIRNGVIETDTVPAVTTSSSNDCFLYQTDLTSNNNPVVSGSGPFSYAFLSYSGNNTNLDSNLNGGSGAVSGELSTQIAKGAIYDNSSSGLSSDNVQDAIDEIALGGADSGSVEYWVGPDATYFYNSIQTAINDAQSDGHDSSNPAIVIVVPNTYSENVSLKRGIHLTTISGTGQTGTVINGQVTCDLTGGRTSLNGFEVDYDSGPPLHYIGSNAQDLFVEDCEFRSANYTSVDLQNTNSGSYVEFKGCKFISENVGSDVVSHEQYSESLFQRCEFLHTNGTDESALRSANPADTEVEYSNLLGQVLVDDSATIRIENSSINSGSNPILETVSSGDVYLYQIIGITSNEPAIVNNGSGTITQSLVQYEGVTNGGLGGTGDYERSLIERLKVAFDPADDSDWTTVPDTVQEALDILASTGGGNIAFREEPSGTVDGSNKTFTLSRTPISGTDEVYLNGVLQVEGSDLSNNEDYTISGDTITFNIAPSEDSEIRVKYKYP